MISAALLGAFALFDKNPEAPAPMASASVAPSVSVQAPAVSSAVVPAAPSCPEGMAKVETGTFSMGSTDGEPEERPVQSTRVVAFCMDITEVTVEAFAECPAALRCKAAYDTVEWPGISGMEKTKWSAYCNGNKTDRAKHPVNCVDWSQATAYCTWRGKRLPTEPEWEYAARGTDGRLYPWGNEPPPGPTMLNGCGTECVRMGAKLGEQWKPMYEGDDGAEATAPVGKYERGKSPFGLLDMAGNVSEWTSSGHSEDYSKPRKDDLRVERGGNWLSDASKSVRAAARGASGPTARYAYQGFRCVKKW